MWRKHIAVRCWLIITILLSACASSAVLEQPSVPASEPSSALVGVSATELLERGLRLRDAGDYDAAAEAFSSLLVQHPEAPEAPEAQLGLGETFLLRKRWASARRALELLPRLGGSAATQERGLLLLAQAYESDGAAREAADAYGRYQALDTLLAPYATLRQAAQLEALGEHEAAAQSFEQAARSDIARRQRAVALEQALRLRQELGQTQAALDLYDELLGIAQQRSYRATLLLAAAELAASTGDSTRAYSWLGEIVAHSPEANEAPRALELLLAAPAGTLDPAAGVQVLFAHGRETEALPLLDAALTQTLPEAQRRELRRLRALVLRAQGDHAAASAELAALVGEAPDTPEGRQARLDAAQTQGWAGDTAGAITSYRQFAAAFPADRLAAEALQRAAALLEQAGDAAAALQQQLDLGRRYPQTEQGQSALRAAAERFEQRGELAQAGEAWVALSQASTGDQRAEALFRAAQSTRSQGQREHAAELLVQAFEAGPSSYEGVRAAEQTDRPFTGTAAIGNLPNDEEWRTVETWLSTWATQPLSDTEAVLQDQGPQRAALLAAATMHSEARAEWDDARERYADGPVQLAQLARVAAQAGAYPAALRAADEVIRQGRVAGAVPAPPALLRLAYPTPFAEIVLAEARAQNIDPLLVYAMVRQESVFDPNATSWVGARGLTQVMPETGSGIATNLGVSSFSPDDLYRPVLSLRFGSYYLSRQIAAMEGSIQGGLAAYNGGPGNAQRWAGGSRINDPEAFIAQIDFPETHHYVRAVYGFYGMYRQLYQRP